MGSPQKEKNHFKINQGFQTDAPHLPQIAHIGNACDDGTKDDRRDHHFNQINERFAQWLQAYPKFRVKMAN